MSFKTIFSRILIVSIFLVSAAPASEVISVQGSVVICLTTSIPLTAQNARVTKVHLKTYLGQSSISEPHTKLSLEVTSIKRSQEYIYPIEFVIDEEKGEEKEAATIKFASEFAKNPQSCTVHYPQEILNKRLAEESIQKAIALIDGVAPHATKVLKTALEVRRILQKTKEAVSKMVIEHASQEEGPESNKD